MGTLLHSSVKMSKYAMVTSKLTSAMESQNYIFIRENHEYIFGGLQVILYLDFLTVQSIITTEYFT